VKKADKDKKIIFSVIQMLKKQGTDLVWARKADVGRGKKFSSECAVIWAQLTIFGAICGTCTALDTALSWVNPSYSQRWGPGRACEQRSKFDESKIFSFLLKNFSLFSQLLT
jgi:hypothetical protein